MGYVIHYADSYVRSEDCKPIMKQFPQDFDKLKDAKAQTDILIKHGRSMVTIIGKRYRPKVKFHHFNENWSLPKREVIN